ncbi:TPA: YeeE/YedE family protein, partial [Pseudomonas aeruginosa]|nr:YeeE/YedE family protein [Pseudomonas aeruginosa]
MKLLSAFIAGLVFGLGLILSGMADPSKVIAFLDLAGPWDPSLAFVMGGAIAVASVGFY